MKLTNKYNNILSVVMLYYGINEEDTIKLLKEKESKYLLLLFLKKYHCMDIDNLMRLFNYNSIRSLNNNLKKAEEKLLINYSFRRKYFEIEDNLLKLI